MADLNRLFLDNYASTITSSISDSATTIPVTSLGPIGSSGIGADNYVVYTLTDGTDYEMIAARSVTGGDTLTSVTRGWDGSTAQAWPSGTTITISPTSTSQLNTTNLLGTLNKAQPSIPVENSPIPTDYAIGYADSFGTKYLSKITISGLLNTGSSDVSAANWVNSTDDTLAVSNTLIPTNEMVKAYVDTHGGGGGSTDSFKTIAVSGQSDVVADSPTDTLTLVAGTNVTITTNASTDTITISSSGGGGGGMDPADILGTSGQITSTDNGDGTATIAIANNPTLPGTAGVVVPSGTGAQQGAATAGKIRYNTSTGYYEGANGFWAGQQFLTDGTFNTGILCKTGDLTYTNAVITGTAGYITVTGGNTAAPTITISSSYVGQTSISTLGTITQGTWSADTIAVNKGGTGQTTYTDGQLLIGNSTGNTLSKSTLTAGSGITITNGAGSITIAATGGGGSGTVNSGTANQLAYYASTGTAVSGLTTANNGVLVTNGSGVPSVSTTLPSGLALQTPASLTLTNATGLVPSTGLSATGTPSSSTYLRGDNTWATVSAGGGDWVKISSVTASNSAQIDFTGLSSTYFAYYVVCSGVLPATNSVMFQSRISISGTFSSSSLYSLAQQGTGAATVAGRVTSAAQWNLIDSGIFGTLLNTVGTESGWRIFLNNPSSTANAKTIAFEADMIASSTTASFIRGSGFYQSTSAIDGIRFFMSSGNISTGIFTLYGLKA